MKVSNNKSEPIVSPILTNFIYTHVQNFGLNKMMYDMLRFVIRKIKFSVYKRNAGIFYCVVKQHLTLRHYTKSVKTFWNTSCVFLFFIKQQVSIIQNKKKNIYASKRWFVKLIYSTSDPGKIYQINRNKYYNKIR